MVTGITHSLTLAFAFLMTALASGVSVFFVMRRLERNKERADADAAQSVLARAHSEAEDVVRRAQLETENVRREMEIEFKEKSMREKESFEAEKRATYKDLLDKERALDKRRDALDLQEDELRKQEHSLSNQEQELRRRLDRQTELNRELEVKVEEQDKALYRTLALSKDEAKAMLMKKLDDELVEETGALIRKHETNAKKTCEETARNILLLALQRYSSTHTAEVTTGVVDIENDEIKGRVIGREGRNIRTFEKVTGVDVIIDDTPGVIILSAFDPMRREIARKTLQRLIEDGRIHPSRIEEVYRQTCADIQSQIVRAGLDACRETDVNGLHERVVAQLGRLQFRTSYSQNVLSHSIDVAFIAGMMAVELGLDENLARRCGLLHDIGKASDHEIEGGHPKIGADILKRNNEPYQVVQAALKHHEDLRVADPYTVLVAAADACSASRPGARRETLENYVRRMEELEQIAMESNFVEQAYAVQAGREMRVMVNSQLTTDESAAKICRDIVKKLTERLQFPGEIKVTVIRESRTTGIAK